MKACFSLLIFLSLLTAEKLIAQPYSFQPRGIGGGGALFSPSINPLNDNEFYVSCDMSELFHSLDFGQSYTQIPFTALQVFGSSTYEFTNDPLIAYSNFNDGNDGYPVKTTDGGHHWAKLNGYNSSQYGHAYSVKANFDNPQQLLIGGYGDILFSNDGGNSFSLVKHASNMGAGLIMSGVYWDGNSIYIGTNEGILFSANAGTTFTVLPASGIPVGQVIWNFTGSGSGNSLRFACITGSTSSTYNGIMPWDYYNYAKGVYVMDQANGNWIPRTNGINFSTDFIMYVGMSRNDPSTLYLGGHDNALYAPLVMKSTDGGESWNKVFTTSNNSNIITGWEGYDGDKNWSWSETCFGLTVAPTNSNKVMFGNFSNIQLTDNGGNSWRQAYISHDDQHSAGSSTPKNKAYHSIGLENTTCWQVHWSDASTLMGCFSDIGGIRSLDGGASWGYQYSGFSVNSLYRIEEDANGILFGACSRVHDLYESTRLADAQLDVADASGMIVYSQDKGASWSNLHVFNHPVYWLAIDPGNQDRMYASVVHFGGTQGAQMGGIYMTNNLQSLSSSTWIKLPNPPRTEGHPASLTVLDDGKLVCTFSGRRNASGAFTASSGVFVYDPVLSSWSDVSDPGMYYWTKDLVIDPADPTQSTWYCCVYSGWGGAPNGLGGLYRTTNRGSNWTKLTGSQFDRVSSITFNPTDLTEAYLTTETQGLWISRGIDDANPAWELVPGYPFRQPQRVFFNPYNPDELWVSSFGNGLKVGNLKDNGVPGAHQVEGQEFTLYPVPSNGCFTISSSRNIPSAELYLLDQSGRVAFHKHLVLQSRQDYVDADAIADGLYHWILTENNMITGRGKLQILR